MAGELKKKTLQRDQIPEAGKKSAGKPSGAAAKNSEAAGLDQDHLEAAPGKSTPTDEPKTDPGETAGTGTPKKRSLLKKAVFIGTPLLLLILAAGGAFFFWHKSNSHADSEEHVKPLTSIKRPIPIPDFRETLDFLIYNEVENQKTLTMLRMEFCFHSSSAYQNFKEQNVLFRETIYDFLLRQNTTRNTSKVWQAVVEKDLLNYLKVKLPQSRADIIRLTQIENL